MALFNHELIAPCGMNCGICRAYLDHSKTKVRGKATHCVGCRPRSKKCAFLKGNCPDLREGRIEFCFQCSKFPCDRLLHLDERYRTRYGMSMIENLEMIKANGIEAFLKNEEKRWSCQKCGGAICVHDRKCYACEI
jgi:hypothetical protein